MLFFHRIKNNRLRELVEASESIPSQPEDAAQLMIDDIAMLPEDGQMQMIVMLEDEQKKIAESQKNQLAAPEDELKKIEAESATLTALDHEFERDMLNAKEEADRAENEALTESLINNIP